MVSEMLTLTAQALGAGLSSYKDIYPPEKQKGARKCTQLCVAGEGGAHILIALLAFEWLPSRQHNRVTMVLKSVMSRYHIYKSFRTL